MFDFVKALGAAAFLFLASGALAASATPAQKPVPGRGAAFVPVNEATKAYAFRTRLSGEVRCQRFATESDAVFLDDGIEIGKKAAMLEKIGAQAKTENCLASR